MSLNTTDVPGGRGGGIVSTAVITTTGAVTLPFTGIHQPISIVGITAVVLGGIVLVAHVILRVVNRVISAR